MKEKPTFKEALKFWTKLGFISFGGPAGQIAIMHEYLVEKKKWISDSKFLHALNYCMLLPGPEAQQLATYTGWLLHGPIGGLAAGILFILPSIFILLGLSVVYVTYGNIPEINAIFNGLKPAVIAIVIVALVKIAKKSLLSIFHVVLAIAAFFLIFFLNVPFPYIILGAVLLSLVIRPLFPKLFVESKSGKLTNDLTESEYFINKNSILPQSGFSAFRIIKQISTGALLWTLPLILFYYLTADFIFWKQLSLFFTQAAFITFGGAYAVLPYVAQISVEKYAWLSNVEMIDGMALGETTPGPLIMILSFVGFMAGHNHFEGSLMMGTVGLLATTFYTFLPCFLFILVGAPLIERTQDNQKVKQILSLVTAAVVGVILNLTLYLGKAIVFPKEILLNQIDILAVLWILISFIALYRFKLNMIVWILISGLFGFLQYIII